MNNHFGQCWYYRDYEFGEMFEDTNPCTTTNSAYPRHENVDFTAPELDFDGMVGSWEKLPWDKVETISKERFESFKPCEPGSYPDRLLRPCDEGKP